MVYVQSNTNLATSQKPQIFPSTHDHKAESDQWETLMTLESWCGMQALKSCLASSEVLQSSDNFCSDHKHMTGGARSTQRHFWPLGKKLSIIYSRRHQVTEGGATPKTTKGVGEFKHPIHLRSFIWLWTTQVEMIASRSRRKVFYTSLDIFFLIIFYYSLHNLSAFVRIWPLTDNIQNFAVKINDMIEDPIWVANENPPWL